MRPLETLEKQEAWLSWAVRLQALAQAGLYYGKDAFDLERYQEIREIAAAMMSEGTGIPIEKVKNLFCGDSGYQTPKIDTRAAIFQDGKILLVHEAKGESAGKWSLPGGWCDVTCSAAENAVKEVREEAGLETRIRRVIAVQDREKHNLPLYAYKVCKIFVECEVLGGDFRPNIETSEMRYFALDELPPLAEEKNTRAQIALCFRAHQAEHWETLID